VSPSATPLRSACPGTAQHVPRTPTGRWPCHGAFTCCCCIASCRRPLACCQPWPSLLCSQAGAHRFRAEEAGGVPPRACSDRGLTVAVVHTQPVEGGNHPSRGQWQAPAQSIATTGVCAAGCGCQPPCRARARAAHPAVCGVGSPPGRIGASATANGDGGGQWCWIRGRGRSGAGRCCRGCGVR